METTEKIVEAYARYVKGWATIPNVRCAGQYEIDLLAIDPKTLERYHIETSVSVSTSFSKLTAREFDPLLLKERVQKAKMRRTLGYFLERKFSPPAVTEKHAKVVVTWGWTEEARTLAEGLAEYGFVEGELWDFRGLVQEIAEFIRGKRSYFSDDTLRTIGLFDRAMLESSRETDKRPIARC